MALSTAVGVATSTPAIQILDLCRQAQVTSAAVFGSDVEGGRILRLGVVSKWRVALGNG